MTSNLWCVYTFSQGVTFLPVSDNSLYPCANNILYFVSGIAGLSFCELNNLSTLFLSVSAVHLNHCWTGLFLTSTPSAQWRTGCLLLRCLSIETIFSTLASLPCNLSPRLLQSESIACCNHDISLIKTFQGNSVCSQADWTYILKHLNPHTESFQKWFSANLHEADS